MAKVTEIYLLSTPFTLKQNETILFPDRSSQHEYMEGRIKHSYNNFSMQRQNRTIKVPDFIDDIFDSNYLMYRNSQNGKWYYCFITGYEYINDNCTEISFKFDVLQTYMFDYRIKPCLIEREHVNNDTIGIHTVDEGISIGEFKRYQRYFSTGLTDLVYIVGSKYRVDDEGTVLQMATRRNDIISYIQYAKFEKTEYLELKNYIDTIEKAKENSILFVSAIPRFCLEESSIVDRYVQISTKIPTKKIEPVIDMETISGYTPKNNKLFIYPYNSLILSNCSQERLLKIENFLPNDVIFYAQTMLSPQPTMKIIPYLYKHVIFNYEESLDFNYFPQCEYTTDAYKNFLNSSISGIFTNVLSTGVNLYTGNYVGAVLNATNAAVNLNSYNLKSDNLMGTGVDGQLSLLAKEDFRLFQQQIKPEYAEIIDKFFSRYGYKVDIIGIPNITGRENFNYVKTKDCLCVGDIPSTNLEEIQNIFDSGITFWHNIENYGDYTIDNPIV